MKVNNPYLPQPITPKSHSQTQAKPKHSAISFEQILKEQSNQNLPKVTLSHHAESRLKSRGIEVTPGLMERLNSAVDKASAKGSKDALVVMDQVAFVVSVKNRTVITAVDEQSMKEHVFTNIDSAILL